MALITDGRFSGGTKGAAIGHVSPEAAAGGPLAFVEEDDIIAYSTIDRTINVVGLKGIKAPAHEIVAALELRAEAGIIPRPVRKGVLGRYTRYALSAMQGAGY